MKNTACQIFPKFPGSTLLITEGVGHEADMEAPDRFNVEVRSFLRSVRS